MSRTKEKDKQINSIQIFTKKNKKQTIDFFLYLTLSIFPLYTLSNIELCMTLQQKLQQH